MRWDKKGLIFVPDGTDSIMHSHASIPFAFPRGNTIRIFFSSRDKQGRSHPFYVDVDRNDPREIIHIARTPLLPLGELGTFDDAGIMPSCIVESDGRLFMYYIGWNPKVTVSYHLSIGLAISEDNGDTFRKYAASPVSDRSLEEPYFNTAPYVLKEGGLWRMWYISTTKWEIIHEYPEPFYHVKYATSTDGVHWKKEGIVCIDYNEYSQAIGRPCVFFEEGIYKMYYSYRSVEDYRHKRGAGYRIGYAESDDGIHWTRKDKMAGIALSDDGQSWDYNMIGYCHVFSVDGRKLMLYNGNGFGKSGFGYASWAE